VPRLWQLALNTPLRTLFTYEDHLDEELHPGTSVKVPFGKSNRQVHGLVIQEATESPSGFEIKKISQKDPHRPPLNQKMIQWLQWVSSYYAHPLGKVHQLVFPPLPPRSTPRTKRKTSPIPDVPPGQPPVLSKEQSDVVTNIPLDRFQTHLLHGVTGSGKTEVYIRLIEEVVALGKTALVLVPEISLTPQLLHRFAERFAEDVAVIHSQLTPREKTEQWWSVVEGKKRLLIGARSALFCPIPDLGIIVIDEEHESSFKQDEQLKYHARDAAIVRAQIENCPIVLGSATPSLETWNNVLENKYCLHSMRSRVAERPQPKIEIVNMTKKEPYGIELPHWLSPKLYEKMVHNYNNQMQTALFLNRRGMAPSVQCYDCGFVYECPNCDISLTLHGNNNLVCHYCEYFERSSDTCPECQVGEPKAYGLGTEAVEKDIQKLFPEGRILRADRDEIHSREAIEDLIQQMERREVDFLVGTQMIAKGLDFPHLTLVGLVLADIAFNIPDFRASEKSFQLCTQVSGRAGRHQDLGEVVIQTYKPEHPSLTFAQAYDFVGFMDQELKNRETFLYPPFCRISAVKFSGIRQNEVEGFARDVASFARALVDKFESLKGTSILGPCPAPLSRIKNRYRYHMLIKGTNPKALTFINGKVADFVSRSKSKIKCQIDQDPQSLM